MTRTFQYDLCCAFLNAETRHPGEVLNELGFEWDMWKAETVFDCVMIRAIKCPETWPIFIKEHSNYSFE